MKLTATLGLLILASFSPIKGDDLIANSDFSDGSSGWGGDDVRGGVTSSTNPFPNTAKAAGLTVPLRADLATRVFQPFRARDPEVTFTFVCTPSANCRFTGIGKVAEVASELEAETPDYTFLDAYGNKQTRPNLNYRDYMSTFSNVTLLIVDRDKGEVHPYPVPINPSSAQAQTITFPMGFEPHHEYELYIAFPPGDGSISLNKVSMVNGVKPDASAIPPPIPNSADNILANQSWSGDVGDGDDEDNNMGSLSRPASPTAEVTVQLRKTTVARIHETFHAPAGSLRFTITCTPSAYCEYSGSPPFTTVGDIVQQASTDNPIKAALAPPASPETDSYATNPILGAISLILIDRQNGKVEARELGIQAAPATTQTDTFPLPVTPNDDYTLLLAFPTGHGSFTLNHVFLTKAEDSGSNH
jgi:hypothetical protein